MVVDNPVWRLAMITGHRPQHLDRRDLVWIDAELRRVLWQLYAENGTEVALSGMALGPDQMWAGHAERIGWDGDGVKLAAHVPFRQQPDPWKDPAVVARYHELLAYADRTGGVHVHGDLPTGLGDEARKSLTTKLLFKRNGEMLRATAAAGGVVVAVLRSAHAFGGTRATYDEALRRGLPVIRVDPDRRTTTMASAGRPKSEQERLPI